ncbi:MAG: alpha/beta hydrolase [Myxococcota bacterium]
MFDARANGTDRVPVTVLFPADDAGAPTGSRRPAVVFIQGGFVSTARYEWQALELARAGYVVALPENQLALAFFSVDYGQVARTLLVEPPEGSLLERLVDPTRIGVAGHSLGSVVSMKLALEGGFAAVALEAGFPDGADDAKLPSLAIPSLSLAGRLDCQAKVEGVTDGWNKLPGPTALVVLEGVTHFQFTADDAEDVRRKCPPEAALDDAHARIGQALRGFFDAALAGEGVGAAALATVPAASVEVR